MYPGNHAKPRADQAAFIMAQSGEAISYAELGRVGRYGDALFIGTHRPAEGHHPAVARTAAIAAAPTVRFPSETVALSRRTGLSVACPALSLGAAGRS